MLLGQGYFICVLLYKGFSVVVLCLCYSLVPSLIVRLTRTWNFALGCTCKGLQAQISVKTIVGTNWLNKSIGERERKQQEFHFYSKWHLALFFRTFRCGKYARQSLETSTTLVACPQHVKENKGRERRNILSTAMLFVLFSNNVLHFTSVVAISLDEENRRVDTLSVF